MPIGVWPLKSYSAFLGLSIESGVGACIPMAVMLSDYKEDGLFDSITRHSFNGRISLPVG